MKTILPLQLLFAPDKNDPRPLVIYHGNSCPDGFANPPCQLGSFMTVQPSSLAWTMAIYAPWPTCLT